MIKKYSIIPAIIVVLWVTGCAKNDEAGGERYNDQARPIGYYSNENHDKGNAQVLEDNDGPLTEMMDHTAGDEENIQQRQVTERRPLDDKNGESASLYERNLSKKIENTADRVENVRNVLAIVYGHKVLIAVDVMDKGDLEKTKEAIKKEVAPFTSGRKVKITTDRESYKKAKTIEKDLRTDNEQKQTLIEFRNLFQQRG